MAALRIQTLDSGLAPVSTYDFEHYEVGAGSISPEIRLAIPRRQDGQPQALIQSDWQDIYRNGEIRLRVHGPATLAKLLAIRNYLLSGEGLIRIFPKFRADEGIYYDGMLAIEQIPEQHVFSGHHRGGETLNIAFWELDTSTQGVVVVDDELPGGD